MQTAGLYSGSGGIQLKSMLKLLRENFAQMLWELMKLPIYWSYLPSPARIKYTLWKARISGGSSTISSLENNYGKLFSW
jgi:hypothetical protein